MREGGRGGEGKLPAELVTGTTLVSFPLSPLAGAVAAAPRHPRECTAKDKFSPETCETQQATQGQVRQNSSGQVGRPFSATCSQLALCVSARESASCDGSGQVQHLDSLKREVILIVCRTGIRWLLDAIARADRAAGTGARAQVTRYLSHCERQRQAACCVRSAGLRAENRASYRRDLRATVVDKTGQING
ncbi:Hypothetical predicted protein [Olea europaea subsp. europaea]|uniref:Uncharacterized protein n=1 Tax=Olea europaea subsp. europaea TaxID=158383 RepID=A0A8S0QAX4_OLEEU|nr:Hypothetical predicted protein [Olea europaea subsp. europaea]